MFEITQLLRGNIKAFLAQQNQENEDNSLATIRLDSNNNPFGSPLAGDYHKQQPAIIRNFLNEISGIKGVPVPNILLSNSNYESVTTLINAFCEPHNDNILICTPTSDYFSQIAAIQAVEVRKVLLASDYQLDIEGIAQAIDEQTKIIFLCTPNNPTGNDFDRADIEIILNNFDGLVVVDETFINYSKQRSFWYEIKEYPNLIVLQNFDVAWGMESANVAMLFAQEKTIEILRKIVSPKGVSQAAIEKMSSALANIDQINQWTKDTVMLRDFLARELQHVTVVKKVYASSTNFLLVRFTCDATQLYKYLLMQLIAVKNCHNVVLCENTLRISVGTLQENEKLISAIKTYSKSVSEHERIS